MKKLLTFFIVATLLVISSSAQSQEKNVTFQLRGGMTISNLYANDDRSFEVADPLIGFNIDAILDIRAYKQFFIQTGLKGVLKGAQIDGVYDWSSTRSDIDTRAFYLEVPIYAVYKIELGSFENTINVATGPYLAYGIAGNTSAGGVSISTFRDMDVWNRFDAGIGFETQFEMKKVLFFLGTEIGLTRAWDRKYMDDSDTYVRNSSTYLGVGFKF